MLPSLANAGPFNAAQAYDQALRLHQQGRLAEAEPLYTNVIQARPDHVDALHMLGMIKLSKGQPVEALRLIAAALQVRKPTPTILFNQGLVFKALARPEDALVSFEQAIKLKSKFAEAHNDRGVVLASLGRDEEAIEAFKKAGVIKTDFADAHYNRGVSLATLGRIDDALRAYERALAINPKYAKAHNNRGVVLAKLGRAEEAMASYGKALALDPGFAAASVNLSQTLHGLGRFDEALQTIERSLTLHPHYARAHNIHGGLLVAFARYPEALASCDRALALDPNDADACNNCGRILYLLNRYDEALAHLEAALARRPEDAEVYYIRGRVLLDLNRNDEALADFDRTLAFKANHADARFGACFAELPIVYRDADEIDRRRAAYECKLTALRADIESGQLQGAAEAVAGKMPFFLAYQGRCDRDLQAIYGGMISGLIALQYPGAALPPLAAPGEKIRVGIVSSFFLQHSNWKMPIKGWLSQLDRSRFSVFGYHLAAARDTETDVAASLCERFVHRPLDVAGWRREILADAPHVLIYPGILMDTVSVQLAAQRLAPVQCNSWGHPDTGGLPSLDYYLSSDLMEPAGADAHYTERLIRLPNLSVYYEPVEAAPVALSREALGLRADAVVFWSGQSLYKYLPQYDDVFPRIAKQLPDSQFVFIRHGSAGVNEVFQARLERAFAALGLNASDHCVFLGSLRQAEFIAAQGLCDVFLDSIDWSGCNSALESLPHDLPIVTVPGALMRGRHSAAILQMMGVTDTIASTIEDYVTIAARLGNAPAERAALSGRIADSKHRVYRDRACIVALEEFLERVGRPAVA